MICALFQSRLGKSLFVLWLAHVMMDFFTGIWPIYKTLANFDLAKAGLIAGISGFFGEILQLGFGVLCDRGHRKKILILGLFLASSILWITFSKDIFSSFWLLLMLMLGSGSFHPAGMGYVGSFSKDHRGKMILIFASGGALGLGISQIVFTKIFHSFDGHALILFAPLICVLVMLLFYKFPEPEKNTNESSRKNFFAPLMKNWRPISLLYFTQLCSYLVGSAFVFLLPDLMMSKTSHTWLIMGGAHLCFILGSAIALPPVGILCDKLGQKKILPFFILGTFILFYVLLKKPSFTASEAIILLVFLGAFFQSINPIIVSWGHKIAPDSPSTISAVLMGFAWCFTNFGPACAGFLCKRFESQAVVSTLSWMGILLVCSLLLSVLIPDISDEEESSQEFILDNSTNIKNEIL